MNIIFEDGSEFTQKEFLITSGIEIQFRKPEQVFAEEYIRNHPRSYFDVELLDYPFGTRQPTTNTLPEGPNDDDEDGSAGEEGKRVVVTHTRIERESRLRPRKIEQARKASAGRLTCEVCALHPDDKYGPLGSTILECHHLTPLANRDAPAVTPLDDLILVCPNCHRMAHRILRIDPDCTTLPRLKERILLVTSGDWTA